MHATSVVSAGGDISVNHLLQLYVGANELQVEEGDFLSGVFLSHDQSTQNMTGGFFLGLMTNAIGRFSVFIMYIQYTR